MPLIRRNPDGPVGGGPVPADPFEAIKSADPDVRWIAVRALATEPDGPAALSAALAAEGDERVREAIFSSLARAATPIAIEALSTYLRSDDARLRRGALDAMRASAAAARAYLPALLGDSDPDVRVLACEVVRELASHEATALLCNLLERESEINVCAAALDVIAEIGSAAALPALSRCAARFGDQPFLAFSIKVARQRIGAAGDGQD